MKEVELFHNLGSVRRCQVRKALSVCLCVSAQMLLHPKFCASYLHFAHLLFSWLLRAMYGFLPDGRENPQAAALLAQHKGRTAALVLHVSLLASHAKAETLAVSGKAKTARTLAFFCACADGAAGGVRRDAISAVRRQERKPRKTTGERDFWSCDFLQSCTTRHTAETPGRVSRV